MRSISEVLLNISSWTQYPWLPGPRTSGRQSSLRLQRWYTVTRRLSRAVRADGTGQGDLSGSEPSWASNISEDISTYKQNQNKGGCFCRLGSIKTKLTQADLSAQELKHSWKARNAAAGTASGCGWLQHLSHARGQDQFGGLALRRGDKEALCGLLHMELGALCTWVFQPSLPGLNSEKMNHTKPILPNFPPLKLIKRIIHQ